MSRNIITRILFLAIFALTAFSAVAQTTLYSGSPLSVSITQGASLNYKITVPERCNLIITLSGGSGNADLYYKKSAIPTPLRKDRQSTTVSNNESITVLSAAAGIHYITVYGASTSSDVSLQAIRSYNVNLNSTKTIKVQYAESVLAVVKVPPQTFTGGAFGAYFGLEFRMGLPVTYYVGDSTEVSPSNYIHLGSGNYSIPNTGLILDETSNKTYYIRIRNSSFFNLSGPIRIDAKKISVAPYVSNAPLSASVQNYLICHGRASNKDVFKTLTGKIAAKIGTTGRCFRVDWKDAANANYPSNIGLDGSRFIKPAGIMLAKLVATDRGIPASNLNLWGHSWGSYVMSEMAKSGGNIRTLVGLDPAETLWLASLLGNTYTSPNLAHNASYSFALVANGLYGGESEAETASLCVFMQIKKGSTSGSTEIPSLTLHGIPRLCMEYSFGKVDSVSKALIASAFNEEGKLSVQSSSPDASMEGYLNSANGYSKHGPVQNGSVTINP